MRLLPHRRSFVDAHTRQAVCTICIDESSGDPQSLLLVWPVQRRPHNGHGEHFMTGQSVCGTASGPERGLQHMKELVVVLMMMRLPALTVSYLSALVADGRPTQTPILQVSCQIAGVRPCVPTALAHVPGANGRWILPTCRHNV